MDGEKKVNLRCIMSSDSETDILYELNRHVIKLEDDLNATRWGSWFQYICILVLILALLIFMK